MKPSQLLIAATLAALSGPVLAGDADKAETTRREIHVRHAGPMGPVGPHAMHAEHMGMPVTVMHGTPATNAPYSAEAVSERTQVLADGNRITNRHSSLSYRDSAGRTRHEVRGKDGEVRTVVIHDGETTLVLRPSDKSGTRISRKMPELARKAREEARAKVEQLRKEGKLAGDEAQRRAHEEVVVRRVERVRHGSAEGHPMMEDVQVRVREARERAVEMRRIAPMIARAAGERKYARDATTRDLGTKEIAGVKAEGKLRSYEIPAGAVGNEKPIVVTDETWVSPELGLTVYSKHSDPRSGEHVYRLENLRRTEPSAELFAAPAGYEIRDAGARIRKHLEKVEKRVEKAAGKASKEQEKK